MTDIYEANLNENNKILIRVAQDESKRNWFGILYKKACSLHFSNLFSIESEKYELN